MNERWILDRAVLRFSLIVILATSKHLMMSARDVFADLGILLTANGLIYSMRARNLLLSTSTNECRRSTNHSASRSRSRPASILRGVCNIH